MISLPLLFQGMIFYNLSFDLLTSGVKTFTSKCVLRWATHTEWGVRCLSRPYESTLRLDLDLDLDTNFTYPLASIQNHFEIKCLVQYLP